MGAGEKRRKSGERTLKKEITAPSLNIKNRCFYLGNYQVFVARTLKGMRIARSTRDAFVEKQRLEVPESLVIYDEAFIIQKNK